MNDSSSHSLVFGTPGPEKWNSKTLPRTHMSDDIVEGSAFSQDHLTGPSDGIERGAGCAWLAFTLSQRG